MPGRALGAVGCLLPALRLPLGLLLPHLLQHRLALLVGMALAAGGNDAARVRFGLRLGLLGLRGDGPLHLGNGLLDLGTGCPLRRHRPGLFQHFLGNMGDDQRFGMFFPLAAVIPVL